MSQLGKGKLTEEGLRKLAYSTALAAATANGKGVAGFGKGSNGKTCVYMLSPPKDSPAAPPVVAAVPSTGPNNGLPGFPEVHNSNNYTSTNDSSVFPNSCSSSSTTLAAYYADTTEPQTTQVTAGNWGSITYKTDCDEPMFALIQDNFDLELEVLSEANTCQYVDASDFVYYMPQDNFQGESSPYCEETLYLPSQANDNFQVESLQYCEELLYFPSETNDYYMQ